ncbi:MAG: hypothetical protein ACFFFH_04770 [Candidatus Thorarchaeota archaeon]
MANIPILAMFFGLVLTVQLHIAKGMEKRGIEVFDQIKVRLKKEENPVGSKEKPLVYTVGMILHNTVFIWQILGTSFGLASNVTSMFGMGLIVLMLYSSKILKEDISKIEYIGASILIVGTVIIGIENLNQSTLERGSINTAIALILIVVFIISGLVLVIYAINQKNPLIVGVSFGLYAGGLGSFDPIFKELGITFGGGSEVAPIYTVGWILYAISFIIGFIALLFTQWGFARKAKASVLVPVYNSVYVTLPIILQLFTIPGYVPSLITVFGVVITIIGITMMQYFKDFSSEEFTDELRNTRS